MNRTQGKGTDRGRDRSPPGAGSASPGGRIAWIDATRGLLVFLVVFHHALCVARRAPSGVLMRGWSDDIVMPFFMQAFFVASGYVSGFGKPFLRFSADNVRTLLFPAILLELVQQAFYGTLTSGSAREVLLSLGGRWFFVALFFAKELAWTGFRLPGPARAAFFLVLGASGLFLGIRCPEANVLRLPQALAFAPFVYAGRCLRERGFGFPLRNGKERLAVGAAASVWLFATGWFLSGPERAPFFGFRFGLDLPQAPVCLLLAVSGTVVAAVVARFLSGTRLGRPLEALGRASLVVYLFHWRFHERFYARLEEAMNAAGLPRFCLFLSAMVSFSLLASFAVFLLLDTRWTRWMRGSFRRRAPSLLQERDRAPAEKTESTNA